LIAVHAVPRELYAANLKRRHVTLLTLSTCSQRIKTVYKMSDIETVSSFVEGAPPGELADVIADIKSLTLDSNPDIVNNLAPAFEKYNEEQFVTVKLPGSSQPVIISSYNSLGDGRYFDVESSSSFVFDHTTQVGCP
jgi:hypothetical protein